jgi:hypothetical protein
MTMGPEAKIVAAIRRKIKKAGGWSVKMSGDEKMAGMPDLIVCVPASVAERVEDRTADRPAQTAFVEVKVPGKHATPIQAAIIAKINAAGGRAFVVHSADEAAKVLCL